MPNVSPPLTNKDKAIVIENYQMEIYGYPSSSSQSNESKDDKNKPTYMEEELESIDLDDLEILALELACHQKDYDKIPNRKIDSLEVVLFCAQQRNSLGIQAGSHWDGKKIIKE